MTVYVNKVGPYANPQETYHYYSLPVCRPTKVKKKEFISIKTIFLYKNNRSSQKI